MSSRRRESPLRIRSPAREEPSRDFRRSSRRPPRHNSNRTSTDFATNSLKNKGKEKLVDEEDAGQDGEEDDDLTRFNKAPTNFDVGCCSRTYREEEEVEHRLQLSQITKARPEEVAEETPAANMTAMVVDEAIENGLSDWAEEEYPEKISDELNEHKLLGLDFVPSNWEKMVDEELAMESGKEITEEGLRLMQELENELILDGLLENDDLLGDELQAAEEDEEGYADEEDSPQRTMTEHLTPISHPVIHLPATSQSPSSKRTRSPSVERRRRSRRIIGPQKLAKSPPRQEGKASKSQAQPKKTDPKKAVPNNPMAKVASKLKPFAGKGSPKRRAVPSVNNTTIPHAEEATPAFTTTRKKKDTKATKPKEGEAEARISPDPPA